MIDSPPRGRNWTVVDHLTIIYTQECFHRYTTTSKYQYLYNVRGGEIAKKKITNRIGCATRRRQIRKLDFRGMPCYYNSGVFFAPPQLRSKMVKRRRKVYHYCSNFLVKCDLGMSIFSPCLIVERIEVGFVW